MRLDRLTEPGLFIGVALSNRNSHCQAEDPASLAMLHAQVLAGGGDSALLAVIVTLRPRLVRRLRLTFRNAGFDVVDDAIQEAFIDYSLRPSRFRPEREQTLEQFLHMAAWRNVANAVAADSRRRGRELQYVLAARDRQQSPHLPEALIASLLPGSPIDCPERKALEAWIDGERRTQFLAVALGVGGCSPSQQRRTVKQFKDRVINRAKRLRPTAGAHR
jgi:hypothetical protein